MAKPKLFVGSSVEGLNVAYAVQQNLKFTAEITVWDQGVFNLSESSLESLLEILEKSDFGAFVFTPDDHIKIRGKQHLAIRDNVLFELGLFLGKLGRRRSFIIVPDNKEFHLPTDLIGMTPAKYEGKRSDGNMQAATGSACHEIREAINKQGVLHIVSEDQENVPTEIQDPKEKNETWYDLLFLKKEYDKAITELKKRIRYSKKEVDKFTWKQWVAYAEFRKDAVVGMTEFENLIQAYPKEPNSYEFYARILYWNNSLSKALEIIENGIHNCTILTELIILKAQTLWALSRKEESNELLLTYLEKEKSVSLYKALATSYNASNDHKKTAELLHQAYFDFPNNEELIFLWAKSLNEIKESEIVLLLYKQLLDIAPNNFTYWCLLGNTYLDLKLENLALTAYEKAAELSNHKESWIYDNLGNIYKNLKLYDKAESHLKRAISLYAESDYTHNRLSQVYKEKQEEAKRVTEILNSAKTKLNSVIIV